MLNYCLPNFPFQIAHIGSLFGNEQLGFYSIRFASLHFDSIRFVSAQSKGRLYCSVLYNLYSI